MDEGIESFISKSADNTKLGECVDLSEDVDRDMDYLEMLVNDDLKTRPDAGAEPAGEGGAASQATSRSEPLGDAEGNYPATGHKKPHEPSIVKMPVLKEMQQAGQAMDQKAVLKVAFPGLSGGSLEGPAGRKAMPDTGTGTADEVSGKTSPLAWLHKVLVLSEPLSGVPAGRISPAPLVISTQKPGSHRRGPPRGKNKGKGHQKAHEPSKNMRQMLKELLQAGQEKDKKAVRKAAFPRGSSGSMPASAAGREAMPDWDGDMDSMLVFLDESLKTSADGGGKFAKSLFT
ncbi:uncharacterized protein LOC135308339 [Passer domesticus]|uniref:uncharacterized protein LOC135308339 n=1 Tax=Passer domesticus TaxID=48849 RepID=UPI0030FDF77C